MPWRAGFEQSLDDLGVDLALTLEDAEDDRLAVSATPAPALDPARAKEALVHLDDPEQGTLSLTGKQNTFPQAPVEPVHGVAVQAAQRRCLDGRLVVDCEIADNLAHLATEILECFAYLFFNVMPNLMPLPDTHS